MPEAVDNTPFFANKVWLDTKYAMIRHGGTINGGESFLPCTNDSTALYRCLPLDFITVSCHLAYANTTPGIFIELWAQG